tara:strand:+ start:3044 stop:3970 length:927 start_codon:yes stop_codon:yes gene_type:complete
MQIHKDIEEKLYKYISKGILNTIFYGPPGIGKHTLILKMLNRNNHGDGNITLEKEKVHRLDENGVRIYTTSKYIRFDAKECVLKKANLPKIIEEISSTRDISGDSNKIIYIRYINHLESQQEAFRQLVEDTYLTCRYVFTCRNIDTIDPALNSRCLLINVSHPSRDILSNYVCNLMTDDNLKSEEIIIQILEVSGVNLNTIKNVTMLVCKLYRNKQIECCPDIVKEMSEYIENELTNAKKLSDIQHFAEKIHYSELSILDLCKKINKKHLFIRDFQKYSSILNPTLYDTFVLLLKLTKKMNIQCVCDI